MFLFVSARGDAEDDRTGLRGRGQLGQRRAAVDLEHAVLPRLPDVVHGAAAAHVAAVLVIQADVELDRPLGGLDDLEEGDLACRAGQLVPSMCPTGAADESTVGEDLEDL